MRYLLIFLLSLLPYLSLPAQTGSHSYVCERTMTNIKEKHEYEPKKGETNWH